MKRELIEYTVEPRTREPLPQGPPDVKQSVKYLRDYCEPLRGKYGAIAAYHILVVLDALEGVPPRRALRERKGA